MKKIMSILLTLAMVCTFTVVPVSAETTLTQDSDGYYLISSADDFVAFRTLAHSDSYGHMDINAKLTQDIDMSEVTDKTITDFTIGRYDKRDTPTYTYAYSGTFDGNGHVIREYTTQRRLGSDNQAAIAIFACTNGATIKNLGIENAYIYNTYNSTSTARSYYGGVIVGRDNGSTTITGCYVKNSTIYKDQKVNGDQWQYAGFIAGNVSATSTVSNCYSVGNTFSFNNSTNSSGGNAIAGFTGTVTSGGTVTNSYAKGNTFPTNGKVYSFSRTTSVNDDCYTDLNKSASSSYSCGATVTSDWSTLHQTLGETAWKADTYSLNGGAPRLKWEADPSLTEYTVTVADGIENGTVTASVEKGSEGTEVTLTVTPASELYKIANVTVNGEAIASPYTFTIGTEDVTVSATFEKLWAKGTGTENDPILIETIADLDVLKTAVNGEKHFAGIYFQLENNLDFTGVTTFGTIGQINSNANTEVRYFSGNFNGNNKTIKNLTINTSARYVSLFGIVKNAVIKNLGIEDSTFRQQGNYYAAGIATQATDSTIESCYVKNSTINVKAGEDSNPQNAGGIVATASGSSVIKNCYSRNNTLRTERSDVYFNGSASGIAGQISGTATVENCYATDLTFTQAGSNLASIARINGTTAKIVNCYSDSKLGKDADSIIVVSETELHSSALLGDAFVADFDKVNGGYPMLAWEVTEAPAYKIILTSVGKDESGVITNVTFETYNGFASGKVYVAVMNGDRFVNAVTANMAAGTVDIEDITLADGETINVFVWDGLNPLMFAEKGLN